ncbi:hypothetical protein AnigIFM63604_004388 [Aspergillus niger]|uniref:C2H2-type domain-containing protein n=1 Tax=Aspergillus niger TaxID=5061 RepID=A0A9W6AAJ7_ASPNG|nr:hypothetical protein AnigIFM63604_004388 [Aspergillus niger]
MGTVPEALTTSQPLYSRRPAAPTLPSFELPSPNFHANVKYPPHTIFPLINPSVSNLPSPPAITQSTTSHTSTTTASANPKLAPYWQGQKSNQSGSEAAAVARQSWNSNVASYSSRAAFSQSVSLLNRNPATSIPGTEHVSPPSEMNHLSPFHHSTSLSAASVQWGALQQQQYAMAHATLSAHNPLPDPASSPHILPSNETPMVKSSSGPAYSTVQQLSNPPGDYSPPKGQMSFTGNLQSGALPELPVYNNEHVAHMQQMQQLNGGHPPHPDPDAPGPTNDRSFKCDQCPQSFHRSYDLKRHKRIHLSVKPFPCMHCSKSFSRKDALKRHMLLKGCGKDVSDGTLKPGEHGGVKEEDQSDGTNTHHRDRNWRLSHVQELMEGR